jgi:osmotically-inducible protein OsmY
MQQRMITCIILLGLGFIFYGCAATVIGAGVGSVVASSTDTRGIGVVVDDQTLEHRVNKELSKQIPSGNFTVASFNQNVLVAGQINSEANYQQVHHAVVSVNGVKRVWNYTNIAPKETLAEISKDAYITSVAKTRLILQKQVNANNIKVVTCDKVVYLLGRDAGLRYQVQGAIQAIKQIDGVHNVVNLIQFN